MALRSASARKNSPLNLPGAFGLYKPSRDIVMKNLRIFGPLYLVTLIFSIHSWIWTPAANGNTGRSHLWDYSWFGSGFSVSAFPSYLWYLFIGFSIFWLIIVIVGGTIAQIMAQKAQLLGSEGSGMITFSGLWATVKQLGWRMFGLYLLILLYVVVGFILLIIPGLIMLRRYFLAPFVMLDKKCSIKEAMDKSAAMSKPYSGTIWGIIGVMILIGFANVIPVIGWLIAFYFGSMYSVAPALRYEQLKKLT